LILEECSLKATKATGASGAFVIALAVLIVWGVSGPLFRFWDAWQLVINTGTTIVTFLMVFLIQRTQSKDALAIHLKLNEPVAAMEGASNPLVDVEDLTEDETGLLHTSNSKSWWLGPGTTLNLPKLIRSRRPKRGTGPGEGSAPAPRDHQGFLVEAGNRVLPNLVLLDREEETL
jgi:low affinity Fe/Cu permease